MTTQNQFIARQKKVGYLWVIGTSTNDTTYVDRAGFNFDKQFECRGQILRVMEIDGVTHCIGRLAIGQRFPIRNPDGTFVMNEKGKQKFTYQPSTEWKWGSIIYFPPSKAHQILPGHVDLRNYFAEDGTIDDKDLYDLVGDVVHFYNESKKIEQVSTHVFQPTPLFTAHDYIAWKQYQAFLQWQQMQMNYVMQ
jgi:hypothetical protein